MSLFPSNQATLLSASPRFIVRDLDQARAFYARLGFETTYNDGEFAIVERDGVALHLTRDAETIRSSGVCWIAVSNIDALYQQYLPTDAVQSAPKVQPWGLKEFFIRDPFCNLLLFAERISEGEKE
jgi:glyoxalase/bleomycin resistance protein/dioxygenase superfamily protein